MIARLKISCITNNNKGVITHLKPDILQCEVKWALGSITTNKTVGGDRTPAELIQILKNDAVKVLHSGLGTHVHPWHIHVDVWQNQYSIVK